MVSKQREGIAHMDTNTAIRTDELFIAYCFRCPARLTITIPEVGLWSDHQSAALADAGWDDDPFTCPECVFELTGQRLYEVAR